MDKEAVAMVGPRKNRRTTHWVVAAAFLLMFATGLVFFVPALSGLAAGGWTRQVHRAAAVVLVGTPLIYVVTHHHAARLWLKDAIFWRKSSISLAVNGRWRRIHKSLVAVGFVLFVSTGATLWFLKGVISSQVFQLVVTVHDVAFISATCVLLYHISHELDWWLWKRKYCRQCSSLQCIEVCPSAAMTRGLDGTIENHPERCNSCRLCMESCRRKAYYRRGPQPL